jgi:hypothetical protein
MTRLCAALLLLLLLGPHAPAQPLKTLDPAKAALIEELIVALKGEQNLQQMKQTINASLQSQINQIVDSQLKNVGDGSPQDSEKRRSMAADIQDFERRLLDLTTAHMSWQTMKPIYVAMYDETFTADELQPLVAFFSSRAGQAYVDKMPLLVGNTMKRMQQVVAEMMPDIQKLNAEFLQEMKEKYPKKP